MLVERRTLGLQILAIAGIALAFTAAVQVASGLGGYDAHAYWLARLDTAYVGQLEGAQNALLYAPPVVIVFAAVATAIPWSQFLLAWSMLEAGAVAWMAGPLTLAVLFLPPVATELRLGNIHAILGVAILIGFRWPAAWSLVLFTKMTPGIGLLWFAFRREWRALAIALGATAAIALPTVLLAPDLWRRWIDAIVANWAVSHELGSFVIPIGPRLVAATVLLWWGARRDRRWIVPIAATLALPQLWDHGFVMLLACIPLAWPSLSPASVFRRSGGLLRGVTLERTPAEPQPAV